jgi:PPOX class probable FMN-dependent enzyme
VPRFEEVVTTEAQFRSVLGHPNERVVRKHMTSLNGHCREFIARCPFLLVASADAGGRMDISPKGDPPGFVRVLDDLTLAIPDRPGNRQAATFSNLVVNSRIGLLFLVPGKEETLRVGGTAIVVRDLWLRETMAIDGKLPEFATVVTVDEAFFHCAKCVIRSALWRPERWPDGSGLPTMAQAMIAAGKLELTPAEMQGIIDRDQRERLY